MEGQESNLEPNKSDDKKGGYDFTAEEVLKALKPNSESQNIEYIGSAVSNWQSEPILYGANGEILPPLSDWGFELDKNIKGQPSGILKNQKAEDMPNFFAKKEDYVNRSEELGQNMFRLSLEFGRLCPDKGQFNEELMADYVRALTLIKARGQEPMLTIQHFTMPKFLLKTDAEDKITQGAWENPDVLKHFRFYIENVTKFLADEDKIRGILSGENFDKQAQDRFLSEGLVHYFTSINEPIMTVQMGYLAGIFPPFKHGKIFSIKSILDKLVEAHDIARSTIKETLGSDLSGREDPQVGPSYNWQYIDGVFGSVAHKVMNELYTDKFERDGTYSDFLGLQYYFRMTAPFFRTNIKGREYSEYPGFGDMYPEGIFEVLKKMNARYPQKEIFITEFGFPDKSDKRRPYWLLETIRYIIEAKKAGVPVKGMLLWSLVNNLEWHLGMSQKFGLFDENELSEPLVPSKDGIRSWEVWQSAIDAIRNPSEKSLQNLQNCYEKAKEQYDSFVK